MSAFMSFLLLMQYVVSVKAGLVNHVQGTANVAPMEQARQGRPIVTAADGYIEVLLTPGSFLRLGENSEVVLDGVELNNVSLRVIKGPAVIEVIDISRNTPIRVTTGNLTAKITQTGIYRFADGVATVLQGKLESADSKLAYEKGWQPFYQDNYRARKASKIELTSLDVYSQSRSEAIARANYSMAAQIQTTQAYDFWLYAPYIGMYTYIPRANFRSPYGHRYYGAGGGGYVARSNGSSTSSGGSSGGSGGTTAPTPPPNTGGGNSGGGGGGAAPAVTVSTPAGQQSTPATYIESKNSPVGATQ